MAKHFILVIFIKGSAGMKQGKLFLRKDPLGRVTMITAIVVSAYWVVANTVNVYKFALSGAAFEFLWLPMLALVLVIPIGSVVRLFWKDTNKPFAVISLLMTAATILYVIMGR